MQELVLHLVMPATLERPVEPALMVTLELVVHLAIREPVLQLVILVALLLLLGQRGSVRPVLMAILVLLVMQELVLHLVMPVMQLLLIGQVG
jgi:hypothetical protein